MQMREPSGLTPDRRQTPRTKLVEIAYIGMGPENGGLVLDVSEGGLSFHSVAPVRQAETINFLLSSRGHNRIEGAGEVVWTNEMKTVCGLRFTSLSAGARDYLNNWTNESRMATAARKKTFSPTPIAIRQQEDPPVVAATPEDTEAESILAIRRAAEIQLSEPMARSMWREPAFFWVMFGILSTVLAATAFIYGVRVGRSETGSVAETVSQLAAHPAVAPDSQASPQAPETLPEPLSSTASSSPSASAVPAAVSSQPAPVQNDLSIVPNEKASNLRGTFVNTSKTDGITPDSFDRPGDGVLNAKTPEQQAEVALEAGKSELAAAQASLRGTNGVRDSSKAARLLWAAVKNNNSTAEVALADLYLRGDGVVKSCEQGRVLLEAASRSGNVQAKEKLGELETNGCP
jgi:hypothetical protein